LKASRDYLDYLQDILAMMEKIENFTAGMTQEDFIDNDMAHFAVIRAMEVMGEATKLIPSYKPIILQILNDEKEKNRNP